MGNVTTNVWNSRQELVQQTLPDPDGRQAAAGAGVGLDLRCRRPQADANRRARLMVNYDLPWNPNRLEQRFGRIHRIGQTEVCHLWNLVAKDTREGR